MTTNSALERRHFLAGIAAATTATLTSPNKLAAATASEDFRSWQGIRDMFELRKDRIHMAGMVMASHPVPVARAIEHHRSELQKDPVRYIDENRWKLEAAVAKAAADYFQVSSDDVALTDSTSMSLAFLYTGLALGPRDEILATHHEHYASDMAIRECVRRTGCKYRRIAMYDDPTAVTKQQLVDSVIGAISSGTRIIAVTWVHSSTGTKIPVAEIGRAIEKINAGRSEESRIYFCVDGVHALGIEDFVISDLHCDFFAAGTHKWLFGPRGTGILWGKASSWKIARPTIPTWEPAVFQAGIGWKEPTPVGGGKLFSPGGYHSFEHRWALDSAFFFHRQIGKRRVRDRIHGLNTRLKDGMRNFPNVRLYTPADADLSSGIVCFMVGKMTAQEVVNKLFEKGIVASVTPYQASYARLTAGLLTLDDDVQKTLQAVHDISARA